MVEVESLNGKKLIEEKHLVAPGKKMIILPTPC
jgi:hypothetical protein